MALDLLNGTMCQYGTLTELMVLQVYGGLLNGTMCQYRTLIEMMMLQVYGGC